MTDPQNPDVPAPPPNYNQAPPPPPASQPAYSSAPPAPYGAPDSAAIPGKTMGIIAFILSFFVQLIALILGIVALVQSRKAGHKNGWAVAAIIISSVLMVIGIIVAIVLIAAFVPLAAELAQQCAELGPGVHTLDNGVTITCGNN
jgi:hypothetical protein